ncbi:restriction endonuclease subunit R [cf. Phormidesmis sp. LEGE 11477]|uniref:restriction endonuclease subunit R n=1 Tax=cf. Phormidesmis sp. LEGE 11477 TaxID=1828680 RepID=UPI00187EBB14|nr:restriction endonuclease subunit R [cf. Phormidesmis sp. LEGE 11477]MBE9059783.1 restriction endonuclease subunit R [cf. Phormidesmis sp. LEGE 11477]
MFKVLQANRLTLREVKDKFQLRLENSSDFFTEWQDASCEIDEHGKETLDQAQAGFLYLTEYPVQEALVKMVVISPVLSVAGFYQQPFRTFAEKAMSIAVEAEEETIRGRIDVLVVDGSLWVSVIEAKGSQFSLNIGLPQTLAYMASSQQQERPYFGLITNGTEFVFVKLQADTGLYALSKTYSLNNPGNDLYEIVGVLKKLSTL